MTATTVTPNDAARASGLDLDPGPFAHEKWCPDTRRLSAYIGKLGNLMWRCLNCQRFKTGPWPAPAERLEQTGDTGCVTFGLPYVIACTDCSKQIPHATPYPAVRRCDDCWKIWHRSQAQKDRAHATRVQRSKDAHPRRRRTA